MDVRGGCFRTYETTAILKMARVYGQRACFIHLDESHRFLQVILYYCSVLLFREETCPYRRLPRPAWVFPLSKYDSDFAISRCSFFRLKFSRNFGTYLGCPMWVRHAIISLAESAKHNGLRWPLR